MTTRRRTLVRRLAAATLATAAAASLAGCSILNPAGLGNGSAPTRDESGQVIEQDNNADVFTLQVGDCLNDSGTAEQVSEVPIVPCSEPHDSEIFASVILTGDEFPGNDVVTSEGDTQCEAEFAAFIGVPRLDSIYEFSFYFPTESSWSRGDREILCVVYDPAGQKLTGSLEGIGR